MAKHSKAEEVFVEIEAVRDVLRLSVKDHGVGLVARQSQSGSEIGIVTIQERAHLVNGRVSFQSKSGEGTEVNVEVPLLAAG